MSNNKTLKWWLTWYVIHAINNFRDFFREEPENPNWWKGVKLHHTYYPVDNYHKLSEGEKLKLIEEHYLKEKIILQRV